MKKDFQTWNGKKVAIKDILEIPFFHEKEIWFCYVGANIGFEQDGQGVDFQRQIGHMNDVNFRGLIEKLKALLP